jgi:excisionase family DNA binding protein
LQAEHDLCVQINHRGEQIAVRKTKLAIKATAPPAAPDSAAAVRERRRTIREVPTVVVRVPEFGAMAHMSTSMVYKLVNQGVLPSVRIGNTLRIPVAALENLVSDAMAQAEDKSAE